MKETTR